jgi:hypothetical protein
MSRKPDGIIPAPVVDLRDLFLRRLTADTLDGDRRRWDYNAPLFDHDQGWAVWTSIDADMVMTAFDDAVRDLARQRRIECCTRHETEPFTKVPTR